jgi:hypothetical protein
MAAQWPLGRATAGGVVADPSGLVVGGGVRRTADRRQRRLDLLHRRLCRRRPAGTAATSEAGGGFFNDEVGQVVCQLVVNTGSTDVSAARAQVFALYDALDASVKADRTLGGVLQGGATSALSYEVQYVSNRQGVAVALIVTVSYQTTT